VTISRFSVCRVALSLRSVGVSGRLVALLLLSAGAPSSISAAVVQHSGGISAHTTWAGTDVNRVDFPMRNCEFSNSSIYGLHVYRASR
jgi:hypothetical protein